MGKSYEYDIPSEQKNLKSIKTWRDREGKLYAFETGMLLCIASFVLVLVSFCSPYWIVSWPRVHSPFQKIGLWEVCFSGLVLELDPNQKAYHGCWWILAPEFRAIRDWLFPPWFIYCQVAFTLCLCAQVVDLGLIFLCYYTAGGCRSNNTKNVEQSTNVQLLATVVIITCVTALFLISVALSFALGWYWDRAWLPMPYLNYLSWSYGLAIVAAFFETFAAIAQVSYFLQVRVELRSVPPKEASFISNDL